MPRSEFPGLYWSKKQLQNQKRERDVDRDWDIFTPAAIVDFRAAHVDDLVAIVQSRDPRQEMLDRGIDLRTLKNLHFSVQVAQAIAEGEAYLAANRVQPPSGVPAAAAAEIANLQNPARIYELFALHTGSDIPRLQANVAELQRSSRVAALRESNTPDTPSSTSVDSAMGRAQRWALDSLRTRVTKPFVPAPRIDGRLTQIDALQSLSGRPTLPQAVLGSLVGSKLDPTNPCFCTPFSYTWTERFSKTWHYDLPLDYPCGVKWCHKRVLGVRVAYPCGVKMCTKTITFTFAANFDIGFELRAECAGILILGSGEACVGASVAGHSLQSCIEAYVIGGAGADIDITAGSQAGKCFYGAELAIGWRATIGSYTITSGQFGYGFSVELPCVKQFNANC